MPKFFQYAGFNLALAFSSSMALFLISPAASGSGIPDVKAYLNGVCVHVGWGWGWRAALRALRAQPHHSRAPTQLP